MTKTFDIIDISNSKSKHYFLYRKAAKIYNFKVPKLCSLGTRETLTP